jgi:hypothetical protein
MASAWLLPALLACTPRDPAQHGDDESDADTDADSDSDTDTDTDTDTDVAGNWRWGDVVTVDDADASLVGASPGDWAGSFLTNVGDTNGDGIDDIAVGAYGSEIAAAGGGAVYLVYGRESAWSIGETLAGAPSVVGDVADLRLERTEPVGDVNGDGLADVGIMEGGSVPTDEFLMFGSTAPWAANVPASEADVIARSLVEVGDDDLYLEDPIGDVDGDGIDDWLLSFRRIDGATAWVLSGASLDGTVTLPGSAVAMHLYGGSLATATTPVDFEPLGDFTGDGLTDVGVSDPAFGYRIVPGAATDGESTSVLEATVASIESSDGGGVFVDPLGDVNGNGFGDLWSIARGDAASGFALFLGGAGIDGTLRPDRATVIAGGTTAFGLYDVGDLNGDGLHDLAGFVRGAVSKDGWDIGIVLGRAAWPATIALDEIDAWIAGVDGDDAAELSTAWAGDFDGDGKDDLVVASPLEYRSGLESAGAVRVFRGRDAWPSEIHRNDCDLILSGTHTNQGMGNRSWLVVADLDGDGRDDIVSSSFYHPTDDGTGTTFVFFGQPAP